MTFFPDLTKYTYSKGKGPKTVNFGWLDISQPYVDGPTDPLVTKYLANLKSEDQFMGCHDCNLCPETNIILSDSNGTKFITTPNGTVYATPAMIAHYIEKHNYQVPKEIQKIILDIVHKEQPETRDDTYKSPHPCKKCGKIEVFVTEINDYPDCRIWCRGCNHSYVVEGPDG